MLNKDLFGNIPVTPVKPKEKTVVEKPSMPEGQRVFHGSFTEEPQEFLKSPVLHVGTADQAANAINPDWPSKMDDDREEFLYDSAEDVDNVHSLAISKHAQIHRITVPDDIANEAHVHFLQEKGMIPTPTVLATRSYHGVEHPLVKSALNALRQNKIVPYKNEVETPKDLYSGYSDDDPETEKYFREASKSYMVPAPHINIVQFGQKEPVSQPLLPMDYTGVLPKSEKTKRHQLIKEMYPGASEGSIQAGRYDDVK